MVEPNAERWEQRLRRYELVWSQDGADPLPELFEKLDLSDLDMMTIRDLLRHLPDPREPHLTAMIALLLAALGQGSLCLFLDREQPFNLSPFLDAPMAGSLLEGFYSCLDQGVYDGLIDRSGSGYKPLVLDESDGRPRLYFQKYHHHEKQLKKSLVSFLSLPAAPESSAKTHAAVIEELFSDGSIIRSRAGGEPIVRDPYQIDAIRAALTAPLLIVSGGPGTGKTSLLVNILRALVRTGTHPDRILLAAPTGRAALRMSEAMTTNLATVQTPDQSDRSLAHLRGSTLHKLLMYRRRSRDFFHDRRRPLDADVVAVDEVSMVDVIMMDRLLRAIDPQRTRVILIGDKDQLPSVEAGAVLMDLDPAAGSGLSDHFVVLRNSYRSSGPLLDLAQAINTGRPVELKPMPFIEALKMSARQWAFVVSADRDRLQRNLQHWIRFNYAEPINGDAVSYLEIVARLYRQTGRTQPVDPMPGSGGIESLFAHVYHSRILCVMRGGGQGVVWINRCVADELRPQMDPDSRPNEPLFHGALIMITRNDYRRGLFNGDVGVVLRSSNGELQACFQQPDRMATIPVAGLSDWELAFAMTIHKSQGSEFQNTLLILPEDAKHRLLTRELVYTAATRASQRLIIYGQGEVFRSALMQRIHRQSGLLASSNR